MEWFVLEAGALKQCMGGAQLYKQDTYGQYNIYVGDRVPSQGSGIQYPLKAKNRQSPLEPPQVLQVIVSEEALTRFSRELEPEEIAWQEGLARIHGLLDFGLFERSNEYHWIVNFTEEFFRPSLRLEAPDFADDLEQRICYHILDALRRARREMPREYTRKKLDPEGTCAILQIARTYSEYIVGRLEERGRIVSHGNLFDGEFHITEEGVQALEEMERSLVKPQWLTRRAPEDVQKHVPEVVQIIKEWIPKQRYGNEKPYESALAEHLQGRGIPAPEQQGASLTDILAAHGIGIEIKLTPNRSEYDRLAGQIMRQLEEFGVVIVLILRPDKQDLLDEYRDRFTGDDRVVFVTKG